VKWPAFFLSMLVLAACTKPESFRTEHAEQEKIEDLPTDFKMPAAIWDLVEKSADEKATAEAGNAGISYSTIKVFLTEKNQNILRSPAFEIEFPRGGGAIDLARYLTGNQGTFYAGIELPEEITTGTNFKAIYISEARKRKINERVFGAGCNQYFDITSKFLLTMKGEGIKANTTRQRHVTVLAGHYIFSAMKDNRIYITQVTLTDSRYKNLLCEAQ
jgi:hypothetical protein